MPVGLTVGGWFASAVIGRLLTVGSTYIEEHYKKKGMKSELQKLETSLPHIQSVVEAAETSTGHQQITEPLKAWLHSLKDAVYEADDVLDELEYLRLEEQVEAASWKEHKVRNLLSHSGKFAIKAMKCISNYDPIVDKLRGVVARLNAVSDDVGNFHTLVTYPQHQRDQIMTNIRETGPLPTENNVFGRDKEREELIQWLMKSAEDESNGNYDNRSNVSLYSVVGHGGMGKTTLVKLAYNDERVDKSFDLKIWVCVSTTFDVKGLTAAMLEYATKEKPKVKNLAALQEALTAKLASEKFLLVLDDAWNNDNSSNWDTLLAPLKFGPKGSKILLTTRMEGVAEMAADALGGMKEAMKLEGLKTDDYFLLFNRYAFAGVNSDGNQKLRSIGTQIAERLGGSPLLAKTVGKLLNSKLDDRHWTNILHSNALSIQSRQGDIIPILMLSYHHLPVHLRPCFAYCSIFPQDYMFEKNDLVLMWMALGLVRQSAQYPHDSLEDIGSCYFDELVKQSFLEPSLNSDGFYVMHDLLHDLAQLISEDECFIFVGDRPVEHIPKTVRHLYFKSDDPDMLLQVENYKNLWTLFLFVDGNVPKLDNVLRKIFKSLKCIRLLYVNVDGVKVLPPTVGELRHLRYLKLNKSTNQLPETLCNLFHLQVITLQLHLNSYHDCVLPKGVNNLISLRHLPHLWDKIDMVPRIRKLTSLQELRLNVKKKRGYKIGELRDLSELRELVINGLENVESDKEAREAGIRSKKHLHTLELNWSSDDPKASNGSSVLDRRVLDCLQPHSNLKKLTIRGYRGVSSADWMDHHQLIVNVEHIKLQNCSGWERISVLGKLPFLKYLHLENMCLVKRVDIDGGFQQLEVLEIVRMEKWEEWSQSGVTYEQWCPRLQRLKITDCPKLKALPSLPLSLVEFILENVGLTALPALWSDSSNNGKSCCSTSNLTSSSSLRRICISRCQELMSLTDGLLQYCLMALEFLEISGCKELVNLPAEGLQHLCSLKVLKLWHCDKLQLVPDTTKPENENFLPSSLQELSIVEACDDSWRSLPILLQGPLASLYKFALKGRNTQLVQVTDVATSSSIKEEEEDLTFAINHLEIDDPFLLLTEPLRKLTSLRKLVIWNCRHLKSMAGAMEQWLLQNRAVLEEVRLSNAKSLCVLPASLQALSSLNYFGITEAHKLQSVPQLPASLKLLIIMNCHQMLEERCRKDEGADWLHIRHIPNIGITQRREMESGA